MPEGMANNANGNVAAAAAAAANGQRRDPSPELRQRGCWGKFWCLNPSRKRGMRIAPARPEGNGNSSNAWASNGASSSTAANQFVGLSPSLLAPPSSPASFANSGNPSTVQSPASFTVSLCVPTANVVCSPAFDSTATMFTIGPYAHETTLVTPPAFSAFTTAPSTAPFTPPPELAHLTTPSSPDVPFAQLLASSLKNAKGGGGSSSSGPQPAAPYSASPFASPDYISRNGDMQSTYQMYPESPLGSLISPASGVSESGPPSPLPELEFPAAVMANKSSSSLSMRRFRPSTSFSGLELPVKPMESNSIDGSANHSRELEPIKILSPPRGYGSYDRHAVSSAPNSLDVDIQNSPSIRDSFKEDENSPSLRDSSSIKEDADIQTSSPKESDTDRQTSSLRDSFEDVQEETTISATNEPDDGRTSEATTGGISILPEDHGERCGEAALLEEPGSHPQDVKVTCLEDSHPLPESGVGEETIADINLNTETRHEEEPDLLSRDIGHRQHKEETDLLSRNRHEEQEADLLSRNIY